MQTASPPQSSPSAAIDRPPRRSPYFDAIHASLARQGLVGYDPRHVEAYMRLEHSTLDGLLAFDARRFDDEVAVAAACVDVVGTVAADELAFTYGY